MLARWGRVPPDGYPKPLVYWMIQVRKLFEFFGNYSVSMKLFTSLINWFYYFINFIFILVNNIHYPRHYFTSWELCLPPSVTGEVYCFPRRQLIFSFGRRVIYHSKGLWEYIPKSIPSLCLFLCITIFKRIARLCFYHESLMLCINGFVSTSSTNEWKVFFKFRIIGWKPNNNQTNSNAWILIKMQCVIYQWICLDKLYKLIGSLFSNFGIIFRINYNFLNFLHAWRWRHFCWSAHVLVLNTTRLPVTRWVKLSLNFESQSRV